MTRATRGQQAAAPSATRSIASAGDRGREMGRARRHSFIVRSLKLLLPVLAVVMVGSFAAFMLVTSQLQQQGITTGPITLDTKNLTMQKPQYVGFGKNGERFDVRAREAVTDLKQSGPVRLNGIDGDLFQATGAVTRLKATWGTYDQKKDLLELYEKIDIDGSNGLKARLTRATVWTKESRVVSEEPMSAETETGTIRADRMELKGKTHLANFRDNVRVEIRGNPAKAGADAARPKQASPLPGLQANSGQPIRVRSEELDVDDTAKNAFFRKNVVAAQGDASLEAPELDIVYEGKASLGDAQPRRPDAAQGEAAKLKLIRARGGVLLANKDDRARSDTLDYEAATERAMLRGGVEITSTGERRATARTADIDQKAETILLLGDVVVTQGKNVLKGRRLFVDRKAGKTRLESPAQDGVAAGRVSSLFYQAEQKGEIAKAKQKPTPSAPVGPFATSFKTDPTAPIDIVADTLDINDPTKTAIYRGKVVARQGDFVVQTAELTAHYTGQSSLMTSAAPAKAAGAAKSEAQGAAQLRKVEARQKVIVTSKEGQSATGDWADFDVKANQVILGGRVVVAQGKNVVEGSRLVIDMTTGRSQFEQPDGATGPAAGAATAAASPAPAAAGPAVSSAASGTSMLCPAGVVCTDGQIRTKQRVRAVIFPKEVEAKAKQKAGEVAGAVTAATATPASASASESKPGSKPPKKKAGASDSAWGTTYAPSEGN